MKTTVGEFLIRRLKEAGVTDVIGVPGDFNLQWIEQFDKVDGIRFVGACNELNAAYAADGYARRRGLGAVLTTYGVGELSSLNAIAGSSSEHVPVVSIGGAPPLHAIRERFSLHHSLADGDFENVLNAFNQFTSATIRLYPNKAVEEIDRALRACLREQRPVHMQLPSDISFLEIDAPDEPFAPPTAVNDPIMFEAALEHTMRSYREAQRPVVLVDLDADRFGYTDVLQRFVRETGTPYASLATGKAIMSERDPLYLGMYGGASSPEALRTAVEDADFLLTTAPRFIEMNSGTFTHQLPAHIVDAHMDHVSVDERVYAGVDVRALLERFADEAATLERRTPPSPDLAPVADDEAWTTEDEAALSHDRLWPRMVRFMRDGDVVIAESGTSSIGLGPQRLPEGVDYVNSSIWGSIGFTLPALFGSHLAAPDRRHLLFIGDGSFQLTAQELSSILRYKQRPIIFLLDNRGYTIERYILGMNAAYNDVANWDYAGLVQTFAPGTDFPTYVVRTEGELEATLAELEAGDRGGFVELRMEPEDAPAGLKKFGPAAAHFDYGPRGPQNG